MTSTIPKTAVIGPVAANPYPWPFDGSVDTAHVALMQSPDHRANVLMRQGQLVGIAAVCAGNTLMVVEDFAIKMGAPLPPGNLVIPPAQPVAAPSQGGAGC